MSALVVMAVNVFSCVLLFEGSLIALLLLVESSHVCFCTGCRSKWTRPCGMYFAIITNIIPHHLTQVSDREQGVLANLVYFGTLQLVITRPFS